MWTKGGKKINCLYSLPLLFKGRSIKEGSGSWYSNIAVVKIQEMGENSIMSFMTSAANQILEAKTKDI